MIWHRHLSIGIHESGPYTLRHVTFGYEVWRRLNGDYRCLGRVDTIQEAKDIAMRDHEKLNA